VLVRNVLATFGFPRAVVIGPEGASDASVDRAVAQRQATLVRRIDHAQDPTLAAVLPAARNVIVVPLLAEGDLLVVFAVGRHARDIDLAARYGGEEFCALLPGCPPADALAVAERLRAAIAGYKGPVTVTASAGVATLPYDAVTGAALVAAADRALYRAKAAGR